LNADITERFKKGGVKNTGMGNRKNMMTRRLPEKFLRGRQGGFFVCIGRGLNRPTLLAH